MVLRPVLECSTAHIMRTDCNLLDDLSHRDLFNEWIHDTGVGFLIRLEAVRFPLLRLKRAGLSDFARKLILQCIRQANISMIHFSAVADELPSARRFEW
ncbi:hypothetical protein BV501_00850 [Erwinia sp. OAMSP11]|nr:hypothetical protein BV501_00850 [Erwinia sp. OAMSP11]